MSDTAVNGNIDISNRTVTKANDLIQRSRFSLTTQQQKIVLYLISQIQPYDEEFKRYKFNIPEFCRICGICADSGKNYSDLKNAVDEISSKQFRIRLANGQSVNVSWIRKTYIDEKNNSMEILLDDDLRPYLLKLRSDYTKYDLIWVLSFRSKYTIRLYELIKSVHFHELETYERTYSLDELKGLLDAEEYQAFYDFKRRVLSIAMDEINRLSDKRLQVEYLRKDKAVTGVKLIIDTKGTIERINLLSEIEQKREGTNSK